jgi:hypothetical protein
LLLVDVVLARAKVKNRKRENVTFALAIFFLVPCSQVTAVFPEL